MTLRVSRGNWRGWQEGGGEIGDVRDGRGMGWYKVEDIQGPWGHWM